MDICNSTRIRKITEYVITIPEGESIDLKTFDYAYRSVLSQAKDAGLDLSYDDALRVTVNEEEIIFSAPMEDD